MADVRDLGDARLPEFRRLEPGERRVGDRILWSAAWKDDGTLTEPGRGLPVLGGSSTRGPDPSSDPGSVSVLGYRFRGLHSVSSEGGGATGASADADTRALSHAQTSPSERLTPILLTDDDLAWLAAYVGEQPYGLEPAQRIYRLLSRTLTELAVMDAEGSDE